MKYFLDTNVFAIFFKPDKFKTPADIVLYEKMKEKIKDENGIIRFYISEITAMEIYSVLGEMSRGKTGQTQSCSRLLVGDAICNNSWIEKPVKKLNQIQRQEVYKLLKDIENQRGDLQAEIINLEPQAIYEGKVLLNNYAHTYSLHSLDSLIGGTVKSLIKGGENICFITLDKKFQNILRQENINLF